MDTTAGCRRILLVEDDAPVRRSVSRLLGAIGAEVREASTLEEARGSVRSSPPDAIVLDVCLPDGDGSAFAAEILDRRGCPIVVMSGIVGDRRMEHLTTRGVAVLRKPFGRAELLDALSRAGALHQLHRSLAATVGRLDLAAVSAVTRRVMTQVALERAGGVKNRAAAIVGVSRQAIQQICSQFGIGSSVEDADDDEPAGS